MHTERNNSKNKRRDRDFYPTPPELASAALRAVADLHPSWQRRPISIIDPGCGTGVWGKAARAIWPAASITGVDLQIQISNEDANKYTNLLPMDYLKVSGKRYDLVMGNPPYSLAEKFVRHGVESLTPVGCLIFLLRLEFLASAGRWRGLYQDLRPWKVYILPQRPSFTGDGKTDAMEYGMFIWRKKDTTALPIIDWLPWR